MKKTILFVAFALFFSAIFMQTALAHSHAYYRVSDSIDYRSDTVGSDRGFTLTRSTDIPRLTPEGYWDWSAHPRTSFRAKDTEIPQDIMREGFSTYQQESRQQHQLDLIHETRRRHHDYGIFGGRIYGISYSYPSYRAYSYGFR